MTNKANNGGFFKNKQTLTSGGKEVKILQTANLSSKTQIENAKSASPSQKQLNCLLEYFQSGRFNDAEKLAISITQDFPEHQFAWKLLGAVLGAIGNEAEAEGANRTAVALSPQDAEAHNNLGVTLKVLGRSDDALACFKKAIALKPDFAEAHNNSGNTLKELGRLGEALASYRRALERKPDFLQAYDNIGFCYQSYIWADLSGKSEKINSLEEAIKLEKTKLKARLKECPFWFVDVPRTSSKTISQMMWNQFGYPFGGRNQKVNGKLIETTSLLLQNHTHAFIAKHVIGDEIWREIQTFTVVRNPYDWCSSLWHYCRENETPDVTHDSFLQFLDSLELNLQTNIYNRELNHKSFLQTDYLLDEDGKILTKHVMRFEDREKIKHQCQAMGINYSSAMHLNKSKNSDYKMKDSERKRVEEIFAKDFAILGY